MKKALGFCFFNCVNEINRSLGDINDPKAICNNVDYIIGIEGRFQDLDYPTNHSTDGSIEAFLKYPNAILYKLMGTEIEKRNKYLEIAAEEKCDYAITWDSDEFLLPEYRDWDRFHRELEKHKEDGLLCLWGLISPDWVKLGYRVIVPVWNMYPRIIKDPGSCEFARTHWMIFKKNARNYMTTTTAIDGVRFSMDSLLRDPKFMVAKEKYMKWNYEMEQKRIGS